MYHTAYRKKDIYLLHHSLYVCVLYDSKYNEKTFPYRELSGSLL
jgi:hypothetical protein